MMMRGTTPTHIFSFPFSKEDVEELYITYAQKKETVIEKTLSDVTFGEGEISVKLSQEDTLAFMDGLVDMQIRVKFNSGEAAASDRLRTTAERILKEGVI